MDDLEAKITERIKQAERRDIRGKANTIARGLGYGDEKENGHSYGYKDSNLRISDEFEMGEAGAGGYTEIYFEDKLVFRDSGEVSAYIPGSWEKRLNKLYPQAQDALRKRKADEEKAQEDALNRQKKERAQRFGL